MKRKNVVIDLIRPSQRADITCMDGEVESSYGVDWLEEESELPDGKNPDAPSGGEKVNLESEWICTAASQEGEIGLPPGSRLLALHRPPADTARRRFVIIQQSNGAIATRGLGTDDVMVNVAFWPTGLGQLRGAAASSGHVMLLGSRGVAWLLYDSSVSGYRLLTSLPESPQVDYEAEAAHFEGYTRVAGNLPEIIVEADLSRLAAKPEASAISNWLSGGDATAVGSAVKDTVYDAVEAGVERYMAEARDAGFFLMPVCAAAAFGTALPSAMQVIDTGYREPYARLASWVLRDDTLEIKIEFSLRPMSLTCSFTLTSLQRQWREYFPSLQISLGDEAEWRVMTDGKGGLSSRPVALTSLSQSDGGGRAFRFSSRGRSEVLASARSVSGLRRSVETATQGVISGILTLRHTASGSPLWNPDYTDFLPLTPDCMASTDEGVVLGEGGCVMVAMKENGVVYRHRTIVTDSPILAISQATLRRGSAAVSRHSLYLFCRDGIRQLTSDGNGGYQNARIVSRTPLYAPDSDSDAPASRVAVAADGVLFMTRRGLQSLTLSGTVRDYGSDSDTGVEADNVDWLIYDHRSDVALLCAPDGKLKLYDLQRGEWKEPIIADDVQPRNPIAFEGSIYIADSSSKLCRLTFERKEKEIAGDATDTDSDIVQPIPPPPGICRVTTRPLKLGCPFAGKRLWGVTTTATMRLTIEGSDDLQEWTILYDGIAPIRGLHSCAFRYHRLILTADSSRSIHLHRLQLTYTI